MEHLNDEVLIFYQVYLKDLNKIEPKWFNELILKCSPTKLESFYVYEILLKKKCCILFSLIYGSSSDSEVPSCCSPFLLLLLLYFIIIHSKHIHMMNGTQ